MAKKKKVDLPVFALVDMPKWKSKIIHFFVRILFPGEAYFVVTIQKTALTSNGKGKYTDDRGNSVDLSD